MHNIVFIAPHTEVYKIAKEVATEMGIIDMVYLVTSSLTECLNVAREAQQNGADVIIARAWTADLIVSSDIAIPVVYIPIGIQDLAETLYQAREKTGLQTPQTALIGSSQMYGQYTTFAELLGMNLTVYYSQSTKNSLEDVVREAVSHGADIIVGGITSTLKAQQLGVPSALLVSGKESVCQALQEAQKIVYARKLEHIEQQKLRAVLNASRDGIISVNPEGRITLINSAAGRILQLRRFEEGRPIASVFPVVEAIQAMKQGVSVTDEMATLEQREILYSILPMRMRGENIGSIITLQEKSSIAALGKKIQRASDGLQAQYTFSHILGNSSALFKATEKAKRYAQSEHSILILGETGTGKELLAQSIHNASSLKNGPFVAVNCGAFAPSLLESELFGYEAGAFTGAKSKGKAGLFEMAHEGTLFLDEISEMDLHGQSRLLRILEERSVMRLGSTKQTKVHLRILAASNVNLQERVAQGLFRQDLYYRLKVLSVQLPPLRHREGDVALLAQAFLERTHGDTITLTAKALNLLQHYLWPGNVRELRYTIESLSMDCQHGLIDGPLVQETLTIQNFTPVTNVLTGKKQTTLQPTHMPMSSCSRAYLMDLLEQHHWHQGQVAAQLGINRSTLYRHMKKLGIKKSSLS